MECRHKLRYSSHRAGALARVRSPRVWRYYHDRGRYSQVWDHGEGQIVHSEIDCGTHEVPKPPGGKFAKQSLPARENYNEQNIAYIKYNSNHGSKSHGFHKMDPESFCNRPQTHTIGCRHCQPAGSTLRMTVAQPWAQWWKQCLQAKTSSDLHATVQRSSVLAP